ncbi:amidohydrolase family protein [Mesobacillus foraminis]|uniref:amidohydrolase family protein n=1 Tax=Mesobacillus foraminis TaxID=279826 RepID=UPI001BEB8978|nr:amidohydrolase family protein [Mesobacillus foraminis]
MHHTLDVISTNRVMYGSDWPVCLLSASYDEVYQLLKEILPIGVRSEEEARIIAINAAQLYRLERHCQNQKFDFYGERHPS